MTDENTMYCTKLSMLPNHSLDFYGPFSVESNRLKNFHMSLDRYHGDNKYHNIIVPAFCESYRIYHYFSRTLGYYVSEIKTYYNRGRLVVISYYIFDNNLSFVNFNDEKTPFVIHMKWNNDILRFECIEESFLIDDNVGEIVSNRFDIYSHSIMDKNCFSHIIKSIYAHNFIIQNASIKVPPDTGLALMDLNKVTNIDYYNSTVTILTYNNGIIKANLNDPNLVWDHNFRIDDDQETYLIMKYG